MKRFLVSTLLAATSACTMGPRDIDAHARFPATISAHPINPRSGAPQVPTRDIGSLGWWHAFRSPQLDALVDAALANSNDIAIADGLLRQAREQAGVSAGSLLPQIDAGYQGQRTQVSKSLSPAVADSNKLLYSLHTGQLTVTYNLDTFGGAHSRTASARAAAEVQEHRADAARTMIVANLVQAVIQHASLTDQITATQTTIGMNRDILSALIKRRQLGAVGETDVATQQTALAAAEGALPPLLRAAAHQKVIIVTLTGQPAGSNLPALPLLSQLTLPRNIPALLPSELVGRRPDVLAAQAQLKGAGADVGTAIAARLPSFQVSANAGGTAEVFDAMFKGRNPFWAVLGGLTQPLFRGGALRHQQRAAEAALDVAKAQYRAAVLQAFADMSDAMAGLRADADAVDAATRSAEASGRALQFVRRQLALGDVGTLALLNATAADAQARTLLVQTRSARFADTVALFQAAGGRIVG